MLDMTDIMERLQLFILMGEYNIVATHLCQQLVECTGIIGVLFSLAYSILGFRLAPPVVAEKLISQHFDH